MTKIDWCLIYIAFYCLLIWGNFIKGHNLDNLKHLWSRLVNWIYLHRKIEATEHAGEICPLNPSARWMLRIHQFETTQFENIYMFLNDCVLCPLFAGGVRKRTAIRRTSSVAPPSKLHHFFYCFPDFLLYLNYLRRFEEQQLQQQLHQLFTTSLLAFLHTQNALYCESLVYWSLIYHSYKLSRFVAKCTVLHLIISILNLIQY